MNLLSGHLISLRENRVWRLDLKYDNEVLWTPNNAKTVSKSIDEILTGRISHGKRPGVSCKFWECWRGQEMLVVPAVKRTVGTVSSDYVLGGRVGGWRWRLDMWWRLVCVCRILCECSVTIVLSDSPPSHLSPVDGSLFSAWLAARSVSLFPPPSQFGHWAAAGPVLATLSTVSWLSVQLIFTFSRSTLTPVFHNNHTPLSVTLKPHKTSNPTHLVSVRSVKDPSNVL